MKFLEYQALQKIGSKAVCWFDVFNVSPKGTEAKEASNLLAFQIFHNTLKFKIPKKIKKNLKHPSYYNDKN